MWNLIFLIALMQLFHVSPRSIEPIEGPLWFDPLSDVLKQSEMEQDFRDAENYDNFLSYYKNMRESDISIREKKSILASLKSSSEKRALSMFARWGPLNSIGKERNPIRSGYSANALESLSTQTRGRMIGQPLRWG